MNIVLLVNSHNLPDIRAFVEAAASSQTTKTPGAISVVYQAKLGESLVKDLVAPLLPLFSAASSLPVPIAASLSDDARNATLFALFIAQVYARYPGPWLIIDGPGIPKAKDFVTEVAKQHKLLDGKVTGRASTQGSGVTPVGPVVLELPAKDLKWFSPGASESWRARARFLLGRCGFRQVPLDEYLFQIPKSSSLPLAVKSSSVEALGNPPYKPFVAVVDEMQELEEMLAAEKTAAASTQTEPVCMFEVGDQVMLIGSDAPFSTVAGIFPIPGGGFMVGLKDNTETFNENELVKALPCAPPHAEASPYDNLSDEDLRTQIDIRDLPKPHHKTGRAKLLSILFEDDDARKSQA